MTEIFELTHPFQRKFEERLRLAVQQAKRHEHPFICYTSPIVCLVEGEKEVTYHIKSFKNESDFKSFLNQQSTPYHFLILTQKGEVCYESNRNFE